MGWIDTVSVISIWGILILSICDFIIVIIANHHPKYSKNKLLYEKLMLPVDISIFFIITLPMLPIIFTNEIPINIKIGLIIFYVGAIGFGVWAVRHQYRKYKALRENSSKSSEMRKDERPAGMGKNFK